MTISVPYESSASISTTEISMVSGTSTLQSVTDDGVYQLWLDLHNLADGDVFEVKVYEKVESGGTQRVGWHFSIANAQGAEPHMPLPSLILTHGWDMTIKRLAGSNRTIAWSIRKVA